MPIWPPQGGGHHLTCCCKIKKSISGSAPSQCPNTMGERFEASTLSGCDLSDCSCSIFIQLFIDLFRSCGSCALKFRYFPQQKWIFKGTRWANFRYIFILRDCSRDAWLGFGVKLGHKKSYTIRCKAHRKPIIPTVGNSPISMISRPRGRKQPVWLVR